jgi:hypothetical protein
MDFPAAYMSEIKSMKRVLLFVLLFAAATVILVFTTASSAGNKIKEPAKKDMEEGFALVELFTSQGCSSCPPADRLLGQYATGNNEHIIAIAFHVDYWNRLGWKDPFSSAAYSDRQRAYSASFNSETVYTPQTVINGSEEMVGSDAAKVAAAISRATAQQSKAGISIGDATAKDDVISFGYAVTGTYNNAVINAALVQRKVETAIRAGENRGVNLSNYNVVRDFKTLANFQSSGTMDLVLPSGAKATDYSIVVFLQQQNHGKVTAVAKKDM